MKMQDGGIVDKELAKMDTDSDNDAAIKKSLGAIVTDKEKNELVEKNKGYVDFAQNKNTMEVIKIAPKASSTLLTLGQNLFSLTYSKG